MQGRFEIPHSSHWMAPIGYPTKYRVSGTRIDGLLLARPAQTECTRREG